MKNKTIRAAKNEGHQDCEDCRRQRAQNEKLISIYEHLQKVDQKTKNVRKSLSFHKTKCQNNNIRFQDINKKIQNVPKKSKATMQLQQLGYQIAKQMVQQVNNGKVFKENKRLKQTLIRMSKPRMYRSYVIQSQNKKSQIIKKKQQQIICGQKQFQEGKLPKYFDNNAETQIRQQEDQDEEVDDQTTNFFSTRQNRSEFYKNTSQNKDKFNNLNLWLYQNKRNVDLQEQLYITGGQKFIRNTSKKFNKRYSSVLPALNTSRTRK